MKHRTWIIAIAAVCLVQGLTLGCLCCGSSLPGITVSGTVKATATPQPGPAAQATSTPAPAPTQAASAGPIFARPYDYAEEEIDRLSEDQLGVLHDLGWPHAFSQVHLPDSQGNKHWVETWHYYDLGVTFVFRDLVFHHQEPERVVPAGQIVPTSYRPNQFRYKGSLPTLNWEKMEAFNELLPPEALFYTAEGVVLGFLDEKVAYIEAVALLPEGE